MIKLVTNKGDIFPYSIVSATNFTIRYGDGKTTHIIPIEIIDYIEIENIPDYITQISIEELFSQYYYIKDFAKFIEIAKSNLVNEQTIYSYRGITYNSNTNIIRIKPINHYLTE